MIEESSLLEMPIEGRFNNFGHQAGVSLATEKDEASLGYKVDLILELRQELREAYAEIGRLTSEIEEMEIADQLTNMHQPNKSENSVATQTITFDIT